jgi:drug/metabolite transporter (DMT)-like permease
MHARPANLTAPAPALDRRPAWPAGFAALTAIWGASFLFIKVGVEALSPAAVALGRMVFGAATLLAVLALRREALPRRAALWGHLAVAAFLLNALPFTLFAYAEQRISSSLAGICNATTPLFTLLVALAALPDERPTRRRLAGLALGFAGALVVLGGSRPGAAPGAERAGALLALAASACYGLGYVYVRRFLANAGHSSLALSAGQLVAGALELAVVAAATGAATAQASARAWLAVGALGVFGTGAAYVLQYGLIRDAGATVAATVSYFTPIASVLLGAVVLGERLTWNAPLGGAVVVLGALVSRQRPGPVRPGASVSPGPAATSKRAVALEYLAACGRPAARWFLSTPRGRGRR